MQRIHDCGMLGMRTHVDDFEAGHQGDSGLERKRPRQAEKKENRQIYDIFLLVINYEFLNI